MRTHCEQSYADGVEILEMQVEWFREQRSRGESLTRWQKRELVITVDSAERATGRMMMNKSSSPKDCIVTEVVIPMSCVYEITHWFNRRLKGLHTAPVAWKVLRLVFLKKPDAKLEKDIRGFRAIALMSVWAKWYCAVLVEMLHEEEEPSEWKLLNVGAERGVYCKHMQALLTNVLQRHWVWSEYRREAWVLGTIWYRTAYVASRHVKTAVDVAKPSGVSHIKTSIDTKWLSGGGVLGRDEGRERVRVHRELRDVVQVFNMSQAGFVFGES